MSNLSIVKRIGTGVRLTATATEAIVANLPEGFDPKARGAVADLVHAWACGEEERPAVKVGPAGAQKATDYGRGVDALVKAVKRALAEDAGDKPVTMRVSLTGVGSAVVPADHPAYALLLSLLGADEAPALTVVPDADAA